jgi:hypothetical protein
MNYPNQMSCIHKQHHHGAKGLEVYATTVACDAKREGDFEGAIVPSGLEVSTEGSAKDRYRKRQCCHAVHAV